MIPGVFSNQLRTGGAVKLGEAQLVSVRSGLYATRYKCKTSVNVNNRALRHRDPARIKGGVISQFGKHADLTISQQLICRRMFIVRTATVMVNAHSDGLFGLLASSTIIRYSTYKLPHNDALRNVLKLDASECVPSFYHTVFFNSTSGTG
jgi:hypothetical protein